MLDESPPPAPPAPVPAPAPAHATVPAGPLHILLVDDHADTARALYRLLQRLGHDVTTAGTVAHALEAFARRPADLLISDISLPDGTGIDLIRQLRAQHTIPGIALSGFGAEEDVRKCKEAGFFTHLTKPINFEMLANVIREAVARR